MKKIDFHSHILPGADHGSDGVETSLFQVRSAISAGIDTIVATPHFYPHRHQVSSFVERRDAAYAALSEALTENGINIDIRIGAEVLICGGMERLPDLDKLCIEGTKVLLIELPFSDFRTAYYETVEELIYLGYTVVLAHCDRYDADIIENMISRGALVQLNAAPLAKLIVSRHLRDWIADGLVVALGSDIHEKDANAYHRFNKAEKRLGAQLESVMKKSEKLIEKGV